MFLEFETSKISLALEEISIVSFMFSLYGCFIFIFAREFRKTDVILKAI